MTHVSSIIALIYRAIVGETTSSLLPTLCNSRPTASLILSIFNQINMDRQGFKRVD